MQYETGLSHDREDLTNPSRRQGALRPLREWDTHVKACMETDSRQVREKLVFSVCASDERSAGETGRR